jgi:hypothetical protein
VIHNYRWRQALAKGEPKYDDLGRRLAAAPTIGAPTITMEGDVNGAPHPELTWYRAKFTGKYDNRSLTVALGTICLKKRRRPLPGRDSCRPFLTRAIGCRKRGRRLTQDRRREHGGCETEIRW